MPTLNSRLLLAGLLVAGHAFGEPVPGGEVHVERSDRAFDCPNEAELVRAALALGTASAAPGTTRIFVSVRFDRNPSSYVATVSATGQKTGDRELQADDANCARLADSVAVVLAVLLDLVPAEGVASFEPLPPSAPAPKPPSVAAPERTQPPPVASTPPPATPSEQIVPFIASLRAEGALAYGLLGDAVSPYVGGAAAVGRGPVAVALGGDWVVPRLVPFNPLPGTHVRVGLAYGFADGCVRAVRSASLAWEASICLRFAAGVLSGAGRGFNHDLATEDAWFATGPVASLRYRVAHALSLRLDALALVALGHQTLEVQAYGRAFESSPVAVGLAFGPELSIW